MKKILYVVLLFLPLIIKAQKVYISNLSENILYTGVVNYLEIMVEGYKCHEIKVETDNGSIIKDDCLIGLNPKEKDTCTIRIFDHKNKLLSERKFKVENIPAIPYINSGVDKDGSKELFLKQASGISVIFKPLSIDIQYNIVYRVIILRDEKVIYDQQFNNRVFIKELRDTFKLLELEDIVIFLNLKLHMADNIYNLEDLVFIIND